MSLFRQPVIWTIAIVGYIAYIMYKWIHDEDNFETILIGIIEKYIIISCQMVVY